MHVYIIIKGEQHYEAKSVKFNPTTVTISVLILYQLFASCDLAISYCYNLTINHNNS